MRKKDARGFTLIELLIVLVIIGILAAIALPKFNFTRQRAYRSSLLSDLKSLAHAQEVYYHEHYQYAADMSSLEATQSDGVTISINEATVQGWAATGVHDGITAGQCGVFHGDATISNADPANTSGVVACDF